MVAFICAVSFLTACGKNFYFAGRTLPPSGVLNRVMVAIQNPSALSKGTLQFDDALYDIRHSYNNKTPLFSIGGYSGALPVTIQNMPEQQVGAVYSIGDGSLTIVSYAGEKVSTTTASSSLNGISQSIFTSRDLSYIYAASQSLHSLTVVDHGTTYTLNLPGVYRVSINPGNTVALAFVQNTNDVYSVVHLNADQQQAAINNPHWNPGLPNSQPAQDCYPQNLPVYCVFPVSTGSNVSFDHPTKAVFSPDGSTAYVLNCGPECGGTTSGVTAIPITASSLNPSGVGASGIALLATQTMAVPGGVTNGLFNGSTFYLSGQQIQPDGLLAGNLSILNPATGQVTGQYSISDGTHNKMILADDNTLWIGSYQCQSGERYKLSQSSAPGTPFGCITMFNTANNTALVESFKGDGTGVAAVTGLNKVYTAEGGQVYIYNTADGSARDNTNVTVNGTAYDVAYMDAASDGDNTTY
ncbi:hypothetical protein [Acidobacterium sp. S8]|uniref:hypothetical protein n=1 Tax=Acidobacterium sp. S8 TaxID=1641854 RepID=UPI00131E3176|nr:hypothetical protein [Acidobacterium sp. S8]